MPSNAAKPLNDIERQRLRIALIEDEGREDVTSLATIDEPTRGIGTFVAKADGIIAGLDIAAHCFSLYETIHGVISEGISFDSIIEDGAEVRTGQMLATVHARMRTLLGAERVALNFLQRMSGIATLTSAFVNAVEGTGVIILDTRKTAPLLRPFDRYAVRSGGGRNHRYSLADMVLVKDNHIAANDGEIQRVIERLEIYFKEHSRVPIEIEVTGLEQFEEVMHYGRGIIDRVMFDNFELNMLREAVRMNHYTFETEASGGVTLETVRPIAETGVNFISVGALTHSVHALDISLEIEPAKA